MTQQFLWGQTTLVLDHQELRRGFLVGHDWYLKDCSGDTGRATHCAERASRLESEDLIRTVTTLDEQGRFRLDEADEASVAESVGLFVGYSSGPVSSERQADTQAGNAMCVQWGSSVLVLNRAPFQEGYWSGRQYFFEECEPGEQPARAHRLTSRDLLGLVAVADQQGCY